MRMEPCVKFKKSKQKRSMNTIPEPDTYISIIDMGLIWHLATPTTEDREKINGIKYTWRVVRLSSGLFRETVFTLCLMLVLD